MGTRVRTSLALVIVAAIVIGIALKYARRSRHPDKVTVPTFERGDVPDAFARLRARGLRVAIPATTHFYATTAPRVASVTPRPGARVDWGSVVTLHVATGFIGSPVGPKKLPVYRVPDFAGQPLANAVAWTQGKLVYWETELPPLPPSRANRLFDAYVVTSQRPAAGSEVRLWMREGRGVRPTPLVLDVALR
jgi:hypothetical protein